MKVEEGLDTGPVYACRRVALGADRYLSPLRDELVEVGSTLLVESLAGGVGGLPVPEPQGGDPTIAPKLTPEDLRLHWARDGVQLQRVVRLETAWTTFRGRRLRIRRATFVAPETAPDAGADASAGPPGTLVGTTVTTGHGALRLEEVQPESRGPMPAADWARGVRPTVGERLGND